MIPKDAPVLTPEQACTILAAAGFDVTPDIIKVEERELRWLVRLPGDRLAWFPATTAGAVRLATERAVLRTIRSRCSFAIPEILYESADGVDVRQAVPGVVNPFAFYDRARRDKDFSHSLGIALGKILVEQHTRIDRRSVEGDLPDRPAWPESKSWVLKRVPSVVKNADLVQRIERLFDEYESIHVSDHDRVLVHGDFGFHNTVFHPTNDTVAGIFDYDGAAWADRHHDFRYLLLGHGEEWLLDRALEVYEEATGRGLSRSRIALYNATSAASFLAFRRGVGADVLWCGRTLAADLDWTFTALKRLSL